MAWITKMMAERAAMAAAVVAAGMFASGAKAAVTFDWSNFSGGTGDWATAGNWTAETTPAADYPGGGAATDDSALITLPAGAGAYTVTYTSPVPAGSIESLTLSGAAGGSGDSLTMNLTSALTANQVTLASASTSAGKVTLAIGAGGSLTSTTGVNAADDGSLNLNAGSALTVDAAGALNVTKLVSAGTVPMTISGTSNIGSFTTGSAADSGVINFDSGVNTVTVGTMNMGRSANISSSTNLSSTTAGFHLKSGTLNVGNLYLGSSNSSAGFQVVAGTLTVTGDLYVGYNSVNTTRYSEIGQTGGDVIDTNAAGVIIAQGQLTTDTDADGNPVYAGSSGIYKISGGTLTAEKITLGAGAGAAQDLNYGVFFLNGGTVYLGSGGLSINTTKNKNGSTSFFQGAGGTLAAKADWATGSPIKLNANDTTFQASDQNGNPHNISLGGALGGAGNLVKTGGGSLTLGATNSYTGTTTVTAGALLITGSTAAGSGMTAAAGTTVGGTGTINGAADISGILSPGVGGIGTLSIGSALTLESGSTLAIDLGSAGSSDQIAMLNSAAITAAGPITLQVAGTPDTSAPYTIITGVSGGLADVTVSGFDTTAYTYSLTNDGTGYQLQFTSTGAAVPEPAALSLLAMGAGLMAMRRRR